jgi:molybdopterin-guanine dinucleotide biosynthesis protein A
MPVPGLLPVVLLAGGNSRRFAGDKLRAPLNNRAVLAQVVERVTPIASEVIIATSTKSRGAELAPHLPSSARLVYDRPERWGNGPAASMASAREELGDGPILFVPGDVPWIESQALRRFALSAGRSQAEVAVPFWASGETEHLLQWQKDRNVLSYLPWRPGSNVPSSWRASEFLRAVPRTLLAPVGALTRHPGSFSHITFPSDLHRPALRGRPGRRMVDRIVEGTPKHSYRIAHDALRTSDVSRAAEAFGDESRWYERVGLQLLARHAQEDAEQAIGGVSLEIPLRSRQIGLAMKLATESLLNELVR